MDLTLNSIMVPILHDYTPPFGTTVTRGIDPLTHVDNLGGLNIQQVNDNIIMPFVKMRAVTMSDNESTGPIEYDAKIFINAVSSSTLTLGNGSYKGCKVTIINSTNIEHSLVHNVIENNVSTTQTDVIVANTVFRIVWNGNRWQNICAPAVGKRITQYPQEKTPSDIYPCTKWEDITADFDGAFFRAEGGSGYEQAASFINEGETLSPQAQDTKVNGLTFSGNSITTGGPSANASFSMSGSHNHTLSAVSGSTEPSGSYGYYLIGKDRSTKQFTWYNSSTHKGAKTDSKGPYSVSATSSTKHSHTYTTSGSLTEQSGAETRPNNYAVKYWKRIA